MAYSTSQEEFWASEFGDDYIHRNASARDIAADIRFFAQALSAAGPIESCVELGANVGLNLRALKQLYPEIDLSAVEINSSAAAELRKHVRHVDECSIFDWEPRQADLALVKTVLIHINPDRLSEVYDRLYAAARKYVLICEYYNPTPVTVEYRGHKDRLFKRDFAGEMLDRFADLRLVDYGFLYHRHPGFLHGDQTWFLLEKLPGARSDEASDTSRH